MKNLLPRSYIVLAIVLFGAAIAYFFASRSEIEWLKDLSLNLGTEVVGILLTVILIDSVIRGNELEERKRVNTVAFQQLRIPLVHQLQMLHGMYKAAATHPPEKKPVAASELFTDSYFVQLAFLDFSKPAPVVSHVPIQWMDYLNMEAEKFKSALSRTLEKYSIFLDVDTIEILEDLLASSFLSVICQLSTLRDLDKNRNINRSFNVFSGQGMTELARAYTESFTKLIEVHNSNVSQEKRIHLDEGYWRNDIAPQFGSARISSVG